MNWFIDMNYEGLGENLTVFVKSMKNENEKKKSKIEMFFRVAEPIDFFSQRGNQ